MLCSGTGEQPAKILLVGEAPGSNEEDQGIPLVGGSGDELLRMLIETGMVDKSLLRDFQPGADPNHKGYTFGHMVQDGSIPNWYITNVSRRRPPGNKIEKFFLNKTDAKAAHIPVMDKKYPVSELSSDRDIMKREVLDVDPNIIIACGNTALWALTGEFGIKRWRGSVLPTHELIRPNGKPYKVIPIYHPAFILRAWTERAITIHDIRQRIIPTVDDPVYTDPWNKFNFVTVPSFDQAMSLLRAVIKQLNDSPTKIAVDIETFFHSQISSIAFALDSLTAFCIPILCSTNYKGYWKFEEEFRLIVLMRHILAHPNAQIIGQNYPYDQLYIHRLWLCNPRLWFDTRTMHHTVFPTMPADLAYLASMYNSDHQYWKDENKEAVATQDDERRWRYNCRDAVETFQAQDGITSAIEAFNLRDQAKFEMDLHALTWYISQRGIRARTNTINALRQNILFEMNEIEGYFAAVVGTRVGAGPKASNWWNSPTQVSTLLFDWMNIRPELDKKTKRRSTSNDFFQIYSLREPLIKPILDRLEVYRSKGTFLRNILNCKRPNGRFVTDYVVPGTDTFRFASKQNGMDEGINLQNVPKESRIILGTDPGFIWWDADFSKADAQVVAWDAGDELLKDAFRNNVDLHQMNADMIGCSYAEAKAGVHATNYLVKAKTLSLAMGISISDAQYFIDKWFELHPAIRGWHRRIESEVMTKRYVENAFGFRRQLFERIEDAMTKAVAWIPQSTVAIAMNKGLLRAFKELMPKYKDGSRYLFEILTQTHDAGGGQWHESIDKEIKLPLRECLSVVIPYEDPLIIPVSLETSAISWGDVKKTAWEQEHA